MARAEARVSGATVLAERAAACGVGVLIAVGFVASYTTLRDLAVQVGEFPTWLAPVVPLSFDVGIIVLSLRILLAANTGRPARGLRALVLALSVATVVVNGVASDSLAGRLLHAVPSAMFVICFETVIASARHRALGTELATPDRRFRTARWLLAPRLTWTTWRTLVLDEDDTSVCQTAPRIIDISTSPGRSQRARSPEHPRPSQRPPGPTGTPSPQDRVLDRLAAARRVLGEHPDLTANALAAHLSGLGHPVSTRTAQRIRDTARQHLEPVDPEGQDATGEAGGV